MSRYWARGLFSRLNCLALGHHVLMFVFLIFKPWIVVGFCVQFSASFLSRIMQLPHLLIVFTKACFVKASGECLSEPTLMRARLLRTSFKWLDWMATYDLARRR